MKGHTQTMTFAELEAHQLGGKKRIDVQRGRAAAGSGKDFEKDLELQHLRYRTEGSADIFKLPVSTQPMPPSWLRDPRKAGIARLLAERQRADYCGTLKGGRCIQMEAKATKELERSMNVVRPDMTGGGLKLHQFEALVRARELGALAAVVWQNGPQLLVLAGADLGKAWYEYRLGRWKRLDRLFMTAVPKEHGLNWLGTALAADAFPKAST